MRHEIAKAVTGVVTASPEFARARSIALYAALDDELSTEAIHAAARRLGMRCLFPRIPSQGMLEFAEVARFEDLRSGRYGVAEPPADSVVVDLARIDVVVVPGLAYDRSGRRLGRGGGHYDRAISRARRDAGGEPFFIGLSAADELEDEVPTGELDQLVDAVATESELLRARPHKEQEAR
jgi:5-formyltetrahydrofolate cyclo-ligase